MHTGSEDLEFHPAGAGGRSLNSFHCQLGNVRQTSCKGGSEYWGTHAKLPRCLFVESLKTRHFRSRD